MQLMSSLFDYYLFTIFSLVHPLLDKHRITDVYGLHDGNCSVPIGTLIIHHCPATPYSLCMASTETTHCLPNLQTSTPFTSLP